MGVADQERLKGGIAEMSENNNTGEVKESRLKEIINTQLENQQEKKRPEKKPAREISEKLKHLLSKDIALMNVQKKTRGAEIMGIFARHNFYAGGITPEELRSTLEDLGPTYVKIGQIISSRTDLLPESYCAELVTLRQRVQPLDPEVAKAVIEDQTGKKIDEIFSEFKDEPIGSASIAQAHYGVLKDGTKVVTKVQRPLIAEMMYEDFELLKKIGSIVNVVSDGGDGAGIHPDGRIPCDRDVLRFSGGARRYGASCGDGCGCRQKAADPRSKLQEEGREVLYRYGPLADLHRDRGEP